MGPLFTAIFLLVVQPPSTTAPNFLEPPPVDLSGVWVLNREQSDDPRTWIQQGRVGRASGVRGRGGDVRGSDPTGGRDMLAGANRERIQETVRMATETAGRLVVAQDDSTITVWSSGRPTLRLTTTGKKWKEEVEDGIEVEFKAEWKKGELRVERKIDLGGTIHDTYKLSPETGQLHITTLVRAGPIDSKFRRVYDRLE